MGAQWKQKWREMAADKKGKVSTKFVREIQIAAKLGGANPEYNARLFVAIENAKCLLSYCTLFEYLNCPMV